MMECDAIRVGVSGQKAILPGLWQIEFTVFNNRHPLARFGGGGVIKSISILVILVLGPIPSANGTTPSFQRNPSSSLSDVIMELSTSTMTASNERIPCEVVRSLNACLSDICLNAVDIKLGVERHYAN